MGSRKVLMADNENNQVNRDSSEKYNSQACCYKHKLVDERLNVTNGNVKEIKDSIEDLNKHIKETTEKSEEKIEEERQKRKNQISVMEQRIHTKLDELDEAFRGDGRIGVFEQIRSLKTEMNECNERNEKAYKTIKKMLYTIFLLFIFLIGGTVLGINMDSVKKFFTKDQVKIEKVEKNVGKIDKNLEIVIDKGLNFKKNKKL